MNYLSDHNIIWVKLSDSSKVCITVALLLYFFWQCSFDKKAEHYFSDQNSMWQSASFAYNTIHISLDEIKLNKWGFKPSLFTYRLNRVRRTFWWWWVEWDNTAIQTQDSKSSPGGLRPSISVDAFKIGIFKCICVSVSQFEGWTN